MATKKPIIISEFEINGKWINQDELPKEFVKQTVENTIKRAAKNIGLKVSSVKKYCLIEKSP